MDILSQPVLTCLLRFFKEEEEGIQLFKPLSGCRTTERV